jgi:hypothetical protein
MAPAGLLVDDGPRWCITGDVRIDRADGRRTS